jgi:hypothetical protein
MSTTVAIRDLPGVAFTTRLHTFVDLAGRMLVGASASLALSACVSNTTFTSTWKAPDAQPIDPEGRRVAAVFMSTDETSRRVAEDALVRKLNEHGAQGVATYNLIPSDELQDKQRAKKRLVQAGVDGIVAMRVIDEKERTRVTYEPYYRTFSGYWGYGWGVPYVPADVTTDTVLRVETLVYSLDRDKLLWAGTSRSVNRTEVSKLVDEVADGAAKQMTREGLLPSMRQASASQ